MTRKTIVINSKEYLTPTFIGVGGQKCASTWLSECLRRHPEVFMSSPKELHFFGRKGKNTKNAEWYLKHFENSGNYSIAGEFSTSYLAKLEVAEQIKELCGPVKIIISLRNPTHRFISHYKMCMRDGSLAKEDFCSLNLETFRKATKLVPELLANGSYYQGIRNYIDAFGAANVYVTIKEEIDQNPDEEVRKLYRFLEVDSDYTPPIIDKKVNEGIVPKYDSLNKLRLKTAKVIKRKSPWIINYMRKFRIDETLRRLNSETGQFSLTVEASVIDELNSYYRPETINLQNLLGYEIDKWGFSLEQVQSH